MACEIPWMEAATGKPYTPPAAAPGRRSPLSRNPSFHAAGPGLRPGRLAALAGSPEAIETAFPEGVDVRVERQFAAIAPAHLRLGVGSNLQKHLEPRPRSSAENLLRVLLLKQSEPLPADGNSKRSSPSAAAEASGSLTATRRNRSSSSSVRSSSARAGSCRWPGNERIGVGSTAAPLNEIHGHASFSPFQLSSRARRGRAPSSRRLPGASSKSHQGLRIAVRLGCLPPDRKRREAVRGEARHGGS